MKILEITFIPPAKNKGGGYRGIYQSIKSMSDFAEIDYIGPDFERSIFSGNVKIKKILKPDRHTLRRIFRIVRGITTSYYQSWNYIKEYIRWEEYDAVHIDSSRYFFLADEAKKHGAKAVIRFHNIEKDYSMQLLKNQKSVSAFLQYLLFSIGERKVSRTADKLVFLTKEDAARAMDLYHVPCRKISINPVCFERPQPGQECAGMRVWEDACILITGTLNFGPNENGVEWFLLHVWQKLETCVSPRKLRLIIAGLNPGPRLKKLCRKFESVDLIDSPHDMQPYFEQADVYAAPVFYGAGMKVKAAEALSYGIPVVGTSHVWIGYDAVHFGKTIANTSEEFIFGIKKLLFTNLTDKKELQEKIRNEFQENYSMDASIRNYCRIINCGQRIKK